MRPMLGWEVVKGKQDFLILLQAFAGLWKFGLVTGDELIVSCQSPFCGSALGTFHGSVAWPCPEHFWAFYPGQACAVGRILGHARRGFHEALDHAPKEAGWVMRHDRSPLRYLKENYDVNGPAPALRDAYR